MRRVIITRHVKTRGGHILLHALPIQRIFHMQICTTYSENISYIDLDYLFREYYICRSGLHIQRIFHMQILNAYSENISDADLHCLFREYLISRSALPIQRIFDIHRSLIVYQENI